MAKNLRAGLRQSIKASRKASLSGGNVFGSSPLDLRFALQKTLDPRVTFTRASTGTFVGSDGVLRSATTDEARFDHNPTTGESLGLLVEEARTNLLLQSENLGTTWAPANTTVSTNQTVAPDGVTTADKILETATTAEHNIRQDTASQSAGTYTLSIFAKAAEQSNLQFAATGVLGSFRANFNLATGTLGSVNTELTASIIPYPNNWYRCVVTRTTTASGTLRAQWNIVTSDTAARVESYAGDITKGLFLWGAQIEAGAFATSYIPTTTATATCAADVASITGANFSSWYNQTEGTVFAEFRALQNNDAAIWSFYTNPNGSIRQTIEANSQTRLVVESPIGAYPVVEYSVNTANANTSAKSICAFKTNNYGIALNGGTVKTDTSGTMPTPLNTLNIGCVIVGFNQYSGTIKRLTYWPVRLANPTLQAITSP